MVLACYLARTVNEDLAKTRDGCSGDLCSEDHFYRLARKRQRNLGGTATAIYSNNVTRLAPLALLGFRAGGILRHFLC